MNNLPPKQCWICGSPSNSREHKIKKSDLVRHYGNLPFNKMGGMLHFKDGMSRQVQGPGSKILCYEPVICSNCNDNKSQPWDRAYEQFGKWLFKNSSPIFQRRFIQLENVFEPEGYSSACPFLYDKWGQSKIKYCAIPQVDGKFKVCPDYYEYLQKTFQFISFSEVITARCVLVPMTIMLHMLDGWKRGREIQPKTSFKNQPQGLTDADLRI